MSDPEAHLYSRIEYLTNLLDRYRETFPCDHVISKTHKCVSCETEKVFKEDWE